LSAGWGLITADFLTPYYDITFSKNPKVPKFKRRNKSDTYHDFHLLPQDKDDHVVFFGGKDYLPLFCELTAGIRGARTVFYNSATPLEAAGCNLVAWRQLYFASRRFLRQPSRPKAPSRAAECSGIGVAVTDNRAL
jgi:hypothetical protein